MTEAIYLWAAFGDRNQCPGRVHVLVCEHCACLVSVDQADRHARWHRWNEGVIEPPVSSRPF